MTEIDKLSSQEIKKIQKNLIEQIRNVNKTDQNSNLVKENTLKTDKVKENNIKHSNKNIGINLKENSNTKASNKAVKLENIKVEGINLKDISQIKIKNNSNEKIAFNDLEVELKNNAENKKYKKINNLKFFSEKQYNRGKDNITGLKSFDIKNSGNGKNDTIQFKNIIKENNVIKQIKNKVNIKNLSNKNQQIEIKLKPDSLGKMKINLSIESNKVVGKILVENNIVQNYLENNLQELKSNLLTKGLQVDQFNIESETKDFNQNNQNTNNHFQQFKDGNEKHNSKNNNNVYNIHRNNELTEENLEQIEKAGWRTLHTQKVGFEYFA